MSRETEYYTADDCIIVYETEDAVLIAHEFLDDGEAVWIPRSQIKSIKQNGKTADITMTLWIAREKDLT